MANQYLKSSLLYNAIIRQDTDLVKELLATGANPNIVTRDGASPMHIVIGLADTSVCEKLTELLLTYYGDCNVRDPDGITPLAIACGFGRCDIVKTLLKYGGDPELENNDGEDCLYQARLSGCDGCVALIINHLESQGKKPAEMSVNEKKKKLPRRSSVLNYTLKVQNLIDLEFESSSLADRTFQLDVTSPDHPLLVKRFGSDVTNCMSPPGNSLNTEKVLQPCLDTHHLTTSPSTFHTVPGQETSPADSPEGRDVHPVMEAPLTVCQIANKEVSSPKGRQWVRSEESTNRLKGVLENLSVNTVSSLDLSLDPIDPRILHDLTINTTSSLNRAELCGKMEDLNLCDSSSVGDETLKEMKELMLTNTSTTHETDHRCDKSALNAGQDCVCGKENKENIKRVSENKNRKCTVKKSEVVLHKDDYARFAKKYYVPLSASDLYTDDESMESINRTKTVNIPSLDSGFGSTAKSCCSGTPQKQNIYKKQECVVSTYKNADKSRVLDEAFNPNDSVVAHSTYICEHSADPDCRGDSPTALPVHPDFYSSPRTSSRCVETSLSRESSIQNSRINNSSVSPEVCSTSPSESLEQDIVKNDYKTQSVLSGICRLDTTGGSNESVKHLSYGYSRPNNHILANDSEKIYRVSNFQSRAVGKENDEVFCNSTYTFPHNKLCDHSKSTTFDCPSVNTPVSLKYSAETNRELSSHDRNPSGGSLQKKCCTGLLQLFKDEVAEGRHKGDNSSVFSIESKNSVCSCPGNRLNRVYSDSEGGISLVEVCLPKDDQNCTLHSERCSERFDESTLVLDWREHDEETSQPNHGSLVCTPVKTQQTAVKQQFLSSTPSLYDKEDCSHDSSVISTASSVQVCVSDEIKALRDSDLRQALEARGDTPGPITISTRKAYEIKLARLHCEPEAVIYRKKEDAFCPELRQALGGQFVMPQCDDLETSLAKMFVEPNPKKQWREGTKKTSFNYLLLDPRVTQNLPAKSQNLTEEEGFEVFVKSIFYVGKGKRSRPYAHFKEAIRHITGKNTKEASKKILHIVKIWEAGLGVVSLHVYQNIIPTEAYTREACLIEALGLKRLTNVQSGQFYANVASWSAKKKRQAGVVLLKKAYKIFILEGERQIRAYDIKDITEVA